MTREQAAAFINAQAACAMAEIAGMQADNTAAQIHGATPPHTGADFAVIPERYGIHYNAVLTFFRQFD